MDLSIYFNKSNKISISAYENPFENHFKCECFNSEMKVCYIMIITTKV